MRSASLVLTLSACMLPFFARAAEPAAGLPARAAVPPATSSTPAALPVDEAAVRHAKRIACQRAARKKKLFGGPRKVFIQHCVATP